MKVKKLALNALCSLMAVAMVVGMLTSCSKDSGSDKIVENIPADAVFVIKLNPKQIVENAGCTVDNGKIVLAKSYQDAIKNAGGAPALSVANQYLSYTEGVNLDAVMVFGCSVNGNDVAAVATLSDEDAVKKNLKDLIGNKKEKDGFDVYEIDGGGVIAIKNKMIWFASKLSTITNHIDAAKKENLGKVAAIAELMSADNAFAMATNLPKFKSQAGNLEQELTREGVPANLSKKIADVMNYYACGYFTLAGNAVSGEFYLVDKDGKRNEFGKALNVIDTSFLSNVPAQANSVAAAGSIADPDIKSLLNQLAREIAEDDPQNAVYTDLFTKMDGTAAIAAEFNALSTVDPLTLIKMSDQDLAKFILANLKVIAMAHYPQATVGNYTNLFADKFREMGVTVNTASNGLYTVNAPDLFDLYFGGKNGYLTMANFNENGSSNGLADKFAGKRMMIYGQSETNPTLARFGWDFGGVSELWLEADALKFRCTLTGTQTNFLQAIFEPLTDMNNLANLMQYAQEIERATFSKYSSYYDYEYDYDEYDYEPEEVSVESDYYY